MTESVFSVDNIYGISFQSYLDLKYILPENVKMPNGSSIKLIPVHFVGFVDNYKGDESPLEKFAGNVPKDAIVVIGFNDSVGGSSNNCDRTRALYSAHGLAVVPDKKI